MTEELSTQPVDTTPKAVTVGNTKMIADPRANTIIVLGNREVVVKVEKILDEMDVKAPQVALSTVIGELSLNNDEEFGVDYFLQFKNKQRWHLAQYRRAHPGAGIVSAAVAWGNARRHRRMSSTRRGLINFGQCSATVPAAPTFISRPAITLSAIVHTLDSTGRFKTISRPTVFTSNNKKAIIASGQEIPVPVSTLTITRPPASSTPASRQQIEHRVQEGRAPARGRAPDQFGKGSLARYFAEDRQPRTIDRVDGNQIPTIATRYIRTNVSAPNESTIVLGGLIQDTRIRRNGLDSDILSRIPSDRRALPQHHEEQDRTELIVLMRPEGRLTKLDPIGCARRTKTRPISAPSSTRTIVRIVRRG